MLENSTNISVCIRMSSDFADEEVVVRVYTMEYTAKSKFNEALLMYLKIFN